MSRFLPKRRYHTPLDDARSVSVLSDGHRYGIQFINADGTKTRALLSEEAATALALGLNAIRAGGGEPVVYKWEHIPMEQLVSEGQTS